VPRMYIAWSDWIDIFCVAYDIVYSQSNPSDRDDMVHPSFGLCNGFSVWGPVSVFGWGRSKG